MKDYVELRIIIRKEGVIKTQLATSTPELEAEGIELFQQLLPNIQNFIKQTDLVLSPISDAILDNN
tara:strand:- start:402 stop:599 length:198 start_codon:yes stop_codon:yes gene_type:complete